MSAMQISFPAFALAQQSEQSAPQSTPAADVALSPTGLVAQSLSVQECPSPLRLHRIHEGYLASCAQRGRYVVVHPGCPGFEGPHVTRLTCRGLAFNLAQRCGSLLVDTWAAV